LESGNAGICIYTGKMGLANELSELFPVRQRPGIKSKDADAPVASAFDHGSRRCRVPTVHSKVDSTENSEEPISTNQRRSIGLETCSSVVSTESLHGLTAQKLHSTLPVRKGCAASFADLLGNQ